MGRSEVCFFHPGLRRLPTAQVVVPDIEGLLNCWVRVVLTDSRVFVGSLKSIDNERNLVLMNAVEVRPVNGKEERKAHRGYCMIGGKHIVSIARKKK
jgi:small nuclear ribonucleoprotein (snRNP)-like protein